MTVYLVISLSKNRIYTVYMVLANHTCLYYPAWSVFVLHRTQQLRVHMLFCFRRNLT